MRMDGVARYRPEHDVTLLPWSSVVECPSEAKFSASGIHVLFSRHNTECDVCTCKNLYAKVVLSRGTYMFIEVCQCMTKEMTALAPSAMEMMVGAPRRELLHCRRQTLPLRGSFSSSSSRIHDRELPDGELITVGVKTLLVRGSQRRSQPRESVRHRRVVRRQICASLSWTQKFQRVRSWLPFTPGLCWTGQGSTCRTERTLHILPGSRDFINVVMKSTCVER